MNINELEAIHNEYLRFNGGEIETAVIELISAYREAVYALKAMVNYAHADECGLKIADDALATAKRLGVE